MWTAINSSTFEREKNRLGGHFSTDTNWDKIGTKKSFLFEINIVFICSPISEPCWWKNTYFTNDSPEKNGDLLNILSIDAANKNLRLIELRKVNVFRVAPESEREGRSGKGKGSLGDQLLTQFAKSTQF